MYKRLLARLLRWTLRLDVAINRVYPEDFNPLYYTGGLSNLFLTVLVLSGIFLFFYYVPSFNDAYTSVQYISDQLPFPAQVPYGQIIRGIHRYAADGFIIVILLHFFRNWFTERFRFSRDEPWISGMMLLVFAGFIGVTGYVLVWDQRSELIVAMTGNALSSVPFVGGWLRSILFGGQGLTNLLLPRMLFLHVGPATALYLLLWWHYVRIRHPKVWPPAVWTLFTLGLILLLTGLIPAVSQPSASAGTTPARLALDWFFLLPYASLQYLPSLGLILIGVVIVVYGLYIPYQLPETERELGLRDAGVAQVIDANCTGCELCYYDCPYDAIVMVPTPHPGVTKAAQARKLLAVVLESRCVECGICIGACPFEALELPHYLESDIHEKVLAACRS
ncbi:MAG TPA: cytochrome b N-terminal domain-containing protein [bacterium]|nr:cytochrome b N-terminal domain-containing protein [bacterium]